MPLSAGGLAPLRWCHSFHRRVYRGRARGRGGPSVALPAIDCGGAVKWPSNPAGSAGRRAVGRRTRWAVRLMSHEQPERPPGGGDPSEIGPPPIPLLVGQDLGADLPQRGFRPVFRENVSGDLLSPAASHLEPPPRPSRLAQRDWRPWACVEARAGGEAVRAEGSAFYSGPLSSGPEDSGVADRI